MSARLHERLLERIASEGPITFADFMAAALYDAEDGFFTTSSVAEHFATSPHVSPVFGALITQQLIESWRALGEPDEFPLVELGAGDGTLANQINTSAQEEPRFARALRYIAVDRSERARKQLAERGIETRASVDDVEAFAGCVLANELLDNIPFHLMDGSGEIRVGSRHDQLILEREPRAAASRTVSPEGMALIDSLGEILIAGYAFFFDYGFTVGEQPEPIRGYQSHRLADVLHDPGSRDITGPVDFGSVVARAREAGFQTWGPVSQREALMALGYRTRLDRIRKEQAEHESRNEWMRAVSYFGERGEAAMLVDPDGLGGLKVLALGTMALPKPRAFHAR